MFSTCSRGTIKIRECTTIDKWCTNGSGYNISSVKKIAIHVCMCVTVNELICKCRWSIKMSAKCAFQLAHQNNVHIVRICNVNIDKSCIHFKASFFSHFSSVFSQPSQLYLVHIHYDRIFIRSPEHVSPYYWMLNVPAQAQIHYSEKETVRLRWKWNWPKSKRNIKFSPKSIRLGITFKEINKSIKQKQCANNASIGIQIASDNISFPFVRGGILFGQ